MTSAASKKLLKELPSEQAMKDTLVGLLSNTDQAAALTGAAYLDHALQILLAARFRPLNSIEHTRMFDGAAGGILGTMSAKIRLAYAIRLITPTAYKDLLLVNDIRNTFAHTLHEIDFSHDLVRQDCAKLKSFKPGPLMASQGMAKQHYVLAILAIYTGLKEVVERTLAASRLRDGADSSPP